MPLSGSTVTGCCGTVRTMTGTPILGLVELLDKLHAAQAALEQRVDDDHVRPLLGDLAGTRPVGDDVDEADLSSGRSAGLGRTARPGARPRRGAAESDRREAIAGTVHGIRPRSGSWR